jgi:hypothetical protein
MNQIKNCVNWIKRVFVSLFIKLFGYRKYCFGLSDGNTFVCWSRSPKWARQAYSEREAKIRINRAKIIQTLTDGTDIGRRARDVPDELVNNVLTG